MGHWQNILQRCVGGISVQKAESLIIDTGILAIDRRQFEALASCVTPFLHNCGS